MSNCKRWPPNIKSCFCRKKIDWLTSPYIPPRLRAK
jgi:hypothetical protein